METFLNQEIIEDNMGKVLIATLYSSDPVMLAATKLGPDRLILLVDEEKTKEQEKSLEIIKKALGKVIDIKVVKTPIYDIVEIAKICVNIIDMQPKDDNVYLNITSGRKTKSIGLLFAGYARHDQVKKIAYNPEDRKEVVYLPRLSFKLSNSQKEILEVLENGNFDSIKDLSEKVKLSTAMLYRSLDELADMDLIDKEELKLTDAGRIARL